MKYEFCIYDPIFIKVTGDLVSGIMLSRVVFWFTPNKKDRSKLRAMYQGEQWLVKSREDWHRECGFTRHQYDRAVALLKTKGFIYTEIHLFKNKTSVYIRLNWSKVKKALTKAIAKADYQKGENRISGSPLTGLPGVGKPDYPSTGLLQEYNKGTTLHPGKAGKSTALGGKKMLSKDVQTKFETAKQGTVALALLQAVKGPEGFHRAWTLLVPYFHDIGHTLMPLTKKERGMLNHFRTKIGVVRAPSALLWAIREWNTRFARQVLEDHHQTLPNRPHPKYLLKYAEAALIGCSAGLTPKADTPVQSIAPPTLKKYVVK